MARIKLTVTGNAIFNTSIPVRINDINYGNHVGNDAFVSIIHEARVRWLSTHGYTELEIDGIGLIMAELAIEFKSESFYGDVIDVTLSTGETSAAGFELYYELKATRASGIVVLAIARTGMICFDYNNRKVKTIPGNLKEMLAAN